MILKNIFPKTRTKKIVIIILATIIFIPLVVFFLYLGGLSVVNYNAKYSVVSISGNIDLCDRLFKKDEQIMPSLYTRYKCYEDFAISRKDESLCEKIPKGDTLHGHRNSCYLRIAIDKNDISLCSKIEDFPIYSNLPEYNHCLEIFK